VRLIIDAELTEPPSETSAFRDITLYSSIFLNYEILIQCERDVKDLYWYWLKNRGAFDFVDDFVEKNQETGITMASKNANIIVKFLRNEELNRVTKQLISFS
jgi:hypothetical protein